MRYPIAALFLCLLFSTALHARITLQGDVPPDIAERSALKDYREIYRVLAPDKAEDTAGLTIVFYKRDRALKETYSLPEWGGGGAIGKDMIIIPTDPAPFLKQDFGQTVRHELVHIAVNRISGGVHVPRWFHEGAAMMLSGDESGQEQFILSQAIFSRTLMPLGSIDSVNEFGRFRARVAYCQSRQAVRYFIDTWGVETLGEVLREARMRGSFWAGFESVLSISEGEFEALSRDDVQNRFKFALWFADTYMIWIGILVLFFTGYVATKIRNRRKAKLMEEASEQDSLI